MNLIEGQAELREKSQLARSKTASKNARKRRKKSKPRAPRVSLRTVLLELARDPKVSGRYRFAALQQVALMDGKPVVPFEEFKNEEPENSATVSVRESVDWTRKPEAV